MVAENKKIDSIVNIKDRVNLKFDLPNSNFNMSVLSFNNEKIAVFRNSDIIPYYSAAGKYSRIYRAKLQNDQLVDAHKISFHGYGIPLYDRYNGMEDPKVFEWNDELWCLFVRPNHYITKISMAMLNLDTGKYILFDDPMKRPYTKNWMPYVRDGSLFLVTDTSPFYLYELVEEELVFVKKTDGVGFPVNGGSNIVSYEDRLMAIVHGKNEVDSKRYYWHAVASWNKDFNDMRLGERFIFESEGIEFCLSLCEDGDEFIIPYSVNDDGVNLLKIDRKEFGKLL